MWKLITLAIGLALSLAAAAMQWQMGHYLLFGVMCFLSGAVASILVYEITKTSR